MVTGWSSGPRKPEPPTMLTPGLREWRSGIQAEVSPGWTVSGPHPQVRAKEHAHSMLNHMVAAPSQRSPSLDISLHGTERSREQGRGFPRTLADLTQGSWAPQPPTSPSPAAPGESRWQSSPCLTTVSPGTQSSHHILMLMDPTKVWTFL